MSLLTPFYLIGLTALALPVILHLVRRTPKGQQEFSSLMFLSPSPPVLTHRSRLDQWLLLLLRLLALALLAFAFSRPFWRDAESRSATSGLPGRRLALLIDGSASMQRPGIWDQAVAAAKKQVDGLTGLDEVSLYLFSDRCRRIVSADEIRQTAAEARTGMLLERIAALKPDQAASDLGQALIQVASDLARADELDQSFAASEIVLITDQQQGSAISALQGFEWPDRVRLSVEPATIKGTTNASIALLEPAEDLAETTPRVRVVSAADSTGEEFQIAWQKGLEGKRSPAVSVYVPPGQNRVVKLPRPEDFADADRVVLTGDDQEFDNVWYVAPVQQEELEVLYLGADAAEDVEAHRYYLQLALPDDPQRHVTLKQGTSTNDLKQSTARLIVVSDPLDQELSQALLEKANAGAVVLVAPRTLEAARSGADLVGAKLLAEEPHMKPDPNRFVLLGQIDLGHPLFAPFVNPRYGDFTRIHFWTHWPVSIPDDSELRVPARFDQGQPAVIDRPTGSGRILLLASSWAPEASQLALSSKFVPLINRLVEMAYGVKQNDSGVIVGQTIPLHEWRGAAVSGVVTPSGETIGIPAGQSDFRQTMEPGVYQLKYPDGVRPVAVNLAASESETSLMDLAQLTRFGVRMGAEPSAEVRAEIMRQQKDSELESRQQYWRWGLIVALIFLIAETWWGGARSRQAEQAIEVST